MGKQILTALGVLWIGVILAQVKDISFTEFTLEKNACNTLVYKSGSRIYIPENAFVFENGQKCEGKVVFKYREINSTLDMLISKTPMLYKDTKGKKHTLESGGMFEFYAYCDNKPLKFASNKSVQVRFAVENNVKDLEGFYLDKKDQIWRKINNAIKDFGVETNTRDVEKLWGSGVVPPFEQFQEEAEWGNDWNEEEWGEDDGWDDYMERKTEVFKSMNVNQMGMYNYDKILEEEDRIPIMANFKLKGVDGSLNMVYVAYEGINSLIYFYKNSWDKDFALLPRSDYKIFAIAADGRVALLTEEDKAKINILSLKNKKYTFELELEDNAPQNKQELALITGLK